VSKLFPDCLRFTQFTEDIVFALNVPDQDLNQISELPVARITEVLDLLLARSLAFILALISTVSYDAKRCFRRIQRSMLIVTMQKEPVKDIKFTQ